MTEHSPLSARRELSVRATPPSSDEQVSLVSANNSLSVAPICSVIIPSYCSARTISACLMALLRQDIQLSYEIIVVDSSPDETADLVRGDFPQVRLIHLPQKTGPEL